MTAAICGQELHPGWDQRDELVNSLMASSADIADVYLATIAPDDQPAADWTETWLIPRFKA